MHYIIFFAGCLFTFGILLLGAYKQSFAFVYLAMFLFIVLGLGLFQYGLELPTGESIISSGDDYTTTTIFTSYTPVNDWIINAMANIFFYGGVIGVLMATFFGLRGNNY